MAEIIVRNNFFVNGETGERLSGIRESEIYKNSARIIRNLVLTELGNLKFAKQYAKKPLNINGIIEVLDTRYFFFIVVTKTHIYSVRKSDYNILYTLQHNLSKEITRDINVKMFEDSLMICSTTPQVYEFNKDTGAIGTSNFLSLMKYPIIDKDDVKMDVYKVYKVGEELRVSLLSTYTNPKLESKSDGIYLYETGLKLSRIYKQFKGSVDKDNISSPTENLMFGVFYRFSKNEGKKSYILGNNTITFTGETSDTVYGSPYFTGINTKDISGDLVYGELKTLKNNFTDIGVMSDRLCIISDNVFYFSKKDNYFDFRNGSQADDPFYFTPTPISNQKPTILKMKIGNAMYVATDKGVYVVSYSKVLTSTSYSVFIAGEVPATTECELVGDNFYYITPTNELKCVQPIPNAYGLESYGTYDAEKYDIRPNIILLTKVIIDGRTVLVATNENKKVVYLYDAIDYNSFRRTSLDLDATNELFGYRDHFISDGTLFEKTNNNYRECLLTLNAPYLKTDKGGSYSNDYSSRIQRVFVKMLNENKQAIKGFYIINLNKPLDDKSKEDLFSTYKVECQDMVGNGYSIKILSNENDKVLEILGIDTKISVASD